MATLVNVMRPEIINIDGRRYRKIAQRVQVYNESEEEYSQETYIEEDSYYYDEADSCINEYSTIEKTEDGYCGCLKDIPSFYYKFIIGKNNEKRRSIEQQTKTKIDLPKKGCEGDVLVHGTNRGGVIAAKTKIKTIIDMYRSEQPAGHFLSIPLVSPQLTENFEEFKREVLKIQARGLDASIFQFPERLHLTLCLLTFLNSAELEDALPKITDTTKSLFRKYFHEEQLDIHLNGIEYMNDDPGEVDVIYAKVKLADGSDRLQQFVDGVVQSLTCSGFLKKDYDHVKLHATVMNTLFRENKNADTHQWGKKNRETFNAQLILKKLSDFDFGIITVNTLDISIRGQFDSNGQYKKAGFTSLS